MSGTMEMPTEANPVVIHEGDCLDVLRGMPDGCVDAVITDPPFGVRADDWDDMDPREFARFSMAWMVEAKRVAPEAVIFCTQDSAIYDIARMLWRRVRRMVWNKPIGSQYAGASECGVWFAYETVLHCHDREKWEVVRPKDAAVGRLIKSARESAGMSRGAVDVAIRGKKTGLCYRWEEGACLPTEEQAASLQTVLRMNGEFSAALSAAYADRNRTLTDARAKASEHAARGVDVFTHRTITEGRHPCEKPFRLMADILKGVGADYRTAIDPFAGSGTTAVAALREGRRCILIEKDPKYAALCRERVAAAMGKGSLLEHATGGDA